MDFVAKLKWQNGMILLSNTEEEIENSQSKLKPQNIRLILFFCSSFAL